MPDPIWIPLLHRHSFTKGNNTFKIMKSRSIFLNLFGVILIFGRSYADLYTSITFSDFTSGVITGIASVFLVTGLALFGYDFSTRHHNSRS